MDKCNSNSKLVRQLRIAARLETAAIGFTSVGPRGPKPRPVLVARVTGEEKQLNGLIKGADAVFVDTSQEEVTDKIIKQLAKNKTSMPFGCWLGNNAGCKADFNMLTLDADMGGLKNCDAGKVLQVNPEIEDKYLRQLDELPVDAVMMAAGDGHPIQLSLQKYMQCRRLAAALTRPLLVHVSSSTGDGDLADLWEYGVDGVVIDVNAAQAGAIISFRKIIDKLELEGRRRKIRLAPVIPASSGPVGQPEEPLPDEDGDEEFPDI
jgi:hypothetical protein